MSHARSLGVALVLLAAFLAERARGVEPAGAVARAAPGIVLVAAGHDNLARGILAESSAVGLAMTLEPGSPADPLSVVAAHGARAVLLLTSEERVRLLMPGAGGEAPLDEMFERTAADGDGFAGRVVEAVRGRFVALHLLPDGQRPAARASATPGAPPPPSDKPAPVAAPPLDQGPREKPAALRRPPPMLAITLGIAGTAPLGGIEPSLQLSAGIRTEPVPDWAISGRALLPLTETTVPAPGGEVDAPAMLFLVDLSRTVLASGPVAVELGPGAGVLILPLEIDVAPPAGVRSERIVTGVFYGQVAAGWALGPWFRLRLAMRGGVAAPRAELHVEGQEIATWGPVFGTVTLDGELGWALGPGVAH